MFCNHVSRMLYIYIYFSTFQKRNLTENNYFSRLKEKRNNKFVTAFVF